MKPEFFQDEKLARVSVQARLLFIGLWCLADDEGRLGANQQVIHGQLFPFDAKLKMGELLEELQGIGVVQRYIVEDNAYLQIVHFKRHQRINRPSKSWLPPPAGGLSEDSVSVHGDSSEPSSHVVLRARARELGTRNEELGKGERESNGAAAPAPPLEAFELQGLWNDLAASTLPRWEGMSVQRRKRAQAALAAHSLEEWTNAISLINQSRFCLGDNPRGWRATPDWLLQPGVYEKVMGGNYDNTAPSPQEWDTKRDVNAGIIASETYK